MFFVHIYYIFSFYLLYKSVSAGIICHFPYINKAFRNYLRNAFIFVDFFILQ